MCCLFGMLDYAQGLSRKQQNRVLSVLSVACEVRGRDATGIAYNHGGRLCVYKRPLPARFMRLRLPEAVTAVMGHTRMTTQGSERRNCNNHPFTGRAGNSRFALAHNGVLYNDRNLRQTEKLPAAKIETDSYVAVQLIEKQGALDFESLGRMAEQLMGSFTMTLLDREDSLYIVRGDNPLCLYHFEKAGIYLYASTGEILCAALGRLPYDFGEPTPVKLCEGDILKIDRRGEREKVRFNTENLWLSDWCCRPYSLRRRAAVPDTGSGKGEYIGDLKAVAAGFGYSGEYIDGLLEEGFTGEDIENLLYCGG